MTFDLDSSRQLVSRQAFSTIDTDEHTVHCTCWVLFFLVLNPSHQTFIDGCRALFRRKPQAPNQEVDDEDEKAIHQDLGRAREVRRTVIVCRFRVFCSICCIACSWSSCSTGSWLNSCLLGRLRLWCWWNSCRLGRLRLWCSWGRWLI